jgi:predicted nucleic acid-binding protein
MINSILIDTNLLLLFVVGTTHRSYIAVHKRLRAYSEDDFDLLLKAIANASSVIVTPNTLTETSNLLRQISDPACTEISETFRTLIKESREQYCESYKAAESQIFIRLGLTDAVIVECCRESICVLTSDFDLYIATVTSGGQAINFNHLRELQDMI